MSTTHAVAQPLRVGERAPDVTLPRATGESTSFSSLWSKTDRGLVIVFLRNFG